MSQSEREDLSALVDGELGTDQVRFMLRRIDASVSLRQSWERYHLIGASLRQEMHGFADPDLAERVRHEVDTAVPDKHGVQRWLRWSAGGAIAAGVAVAALVVVQPRMHEASAPVTADTASSRPALASANDAAMPASAPQVPRWLSASAAGRLAQPAAATFGSVGASDSLGYDSPGLAPYMSIPHAHAHTATDQQRSPAQPRLWSPPRRDSAQPVWRLQHQ